ncbi:uncharacterized protein M6B38_386465 [Iris pallida]|uniref:START domain-containing protein n=1 Tax=Iris pallida TaxID=29817 RepID=A0AAX6G2H3_IRIPA|nr:uncharacterized protein M6B38_386465 [Iris pallida]
MAVIMDALVEILRKPTIAGILSELAAFAAPLWIAALVGLLLGWAWRPRWAVEVVPAVSADAKLGSFTRRGVEVDDNDDFDSLSVESEGLAVTAEDFEHLRRLVQVRDGGPEWKPMMEKAAPGFSYWAWKREPEKGPPEYRSSTVFDGAAPEFVRDFFWDDEFRTGNGWDDMLLEHTILEECGKTGTMVVRWVRKFPFFCSDREYIIGRRIWEVDGTYYCVTKGVPRLSVPRHKKPRRVDLYYSSWCIRAVASRTDGQMTACEVLLFHHEDMGIPWEIAKLGVRQGMWGCVKKIEPGLRAYQIARGRGEPASRCAIMAGINTKVHANYLESMEETSSSSKEIVEDEKPKPWCGNLPKFLVIGGAVVVACSLDQGLLTKAVIFGVARRFGKLGR